MRIAGYGAAVLFLSTMAAKLLIKEIYSSIQGESTWAGWPCVFVRLAGCDLRCSYCDSAYAFAGGISMTVESVVEDVRRLAESYSNARQQGQRLPLVEITGGEPLLQASVHSLMRRLCDLGFAVLLETSGAHSIEGTDLRVCRIVDLKCPSSGETDRILWENIPALRRTDEVKFVIGSRQDYEWAKTVENRHRLASVCPVLFSAAAPLTPRQASPLLKTAPPGHTPLSRRELAESILRDKLPVRFQLQVHKFVWPADRTGV